MFLYYLASLDIDVRSHASHDDLNTYWINVRSFTQYYTPLPANGKLQKICKISYEPE